MDEKFIIDRLAVHFVDRRNQRIETAKGEQIVKDLDPVVISFITKLINEIWDAEDKGRSTSANFIDENPSSKITRDQVLLIKVDESRFFQASVKLAHHLYSQSTGNASTGLLGVVRLVRSSNKDVMVALLKIQVNNRKFVKLGATTLTQMTVEDVENMLLEEIQKGAIYPHPERPKYDLKVIDKQTPSEAAKYFSEGFLGCKQKRSDEHQVKKFLSTIEAFSEERGIDVGYDKLPNLVDHLRRQGEDISTRVVAQSIEDESVMAGSYKKDDFIKYVREESDLGEIDIPKRSFEARSGANYKSRELSFEFSDPKYHGVTLSGPVAILKELISSIDDTVTFTITTTKKGFRVKYE